MASSAKLIDNLLYIAPVLAVVIDPKYRIVDLNREAIREFGHLDKIKGKLFWTLFPSIEEKRIKEFVSIGFSLKGRSPHEVFQGFPKNHRNLSRFFEMTTIRFLKGRKNYLLVTFDNVSAMVQFLSREEAERSKASQITSLLKETDARLQIALKAGRMGTWEVDMASRILKWSRGLIDPLKPEFSFSVESYLKQVHPDDRGKVRRGMNKSFRQKGVFHIEFRILVKSVIHWISTTGVLVGRENSQKMTGVWIDITLRRNMEERVRLQYTLNRILARSSNLEDASKSILERLGNSFGWDAGVFWKASESGKMLKCFDLWHAKGVDLRKLGFPSKNDEIKLGLGLAGQVAKQKKAIWAGKRETFAVVGFPLIFGKEVFGVIVFYSNEFHSLNRETLRLTTIIGNQVGEFIHRIRTRSELARSKAELETILQTVAEGIVVQNTKGEIIYANAEAVKIAGYKDVDEFKKRSYKDASAKVEFYDEEGRLLKMDELPPAFAVQGKSAEAVVRYRVKGMEEDRWIHAKSRPVFNGDGKVQLVVSVILDITQEVHDEKQRELFLSMATHELRTPIASIKAYSQLATRRARVSEVKNFLSKINEQSDRLINIINSFLDMTKVREGKLAIRKRKVDFDELVEKIIFPIKASVSTHKIIKKGKIGTKIYADPDRIGQVLNNLITNAIKYSPNAKRVIVEIKREEDKVKVSVQDFGIGIPKGQEHNIFKSFYQVPRTARGEGLGLGLYISAGIIKGHGGRIWVESKPKKGSNFFFTIPLK